MGGRRFVIYILQRKQMANIIRKMWMCAQVNQVDKWEKQIWADEALGDTRVTYNSCTSFLFQENVFIPLRVAHTNVDIMQSSHFLIRLSIRNILSTLQPVDLVCTKSKHFYWVFDELFVCCIKVLRLYVLSHAFLYDTPCHTISCWSWLRVEWELNESK